MEKKILVVALMMLFVGMQAGQGFAEIFVPPGEDDKIEFNTETGVYEVVNPLYEEIVINANDVTLDGCGFTVTGSYGSDGITITDKTNVVVTDLIVTGFTTGIYVNNGGGHHLVGNTVDNSNTFGINIVSATDNTIKDNTITDSVNYHGIFLLNACSDNVIENNIVTGNKLCGIMISDNGCDNNQIFDNLIEGNGTGLNLYQSYNNIIYNNNFIDNSGQIGGTSTSGNTYNMASPTGGNYYSDWDEDDGHYDLLPIDGFIDDVRVLPGGTDFLPLVVPDTPETFGIRDIIHYYDTCLGTGDIVGIDGPPGPPASKRLSSFRNMLVDAQAAIIAGQYVLACEELYDALAAFDGQKPPDLIEGSGIEELGNRINALINLLETE